MNLTHVAHLVLAHINEHDLNWSVALPEGQTAVRVRTEDGDVHLVSLDERNAIVWRWSRLALAGHRVAVARTILLPQNDQEHLAGVFTLTPTTRTEPATGPADQSADGSADMVINYEAYVDLDQYELTDANIADVFVTDVSRLLEVAARYEEFVARRVANDAVLADDEHDWPAAVAALIDDNTTPAMLGIIFERFEGNSVHEHVFYHPAADARIRHRVVDSWNEVAGPDRAQPFGDPHASSETFATERADSVASLSSGDA